jgi:gamma-glutamyl-gamma-aminobutyrate hydrolase PuuD
MKVYIVESSQQYEDMWVNAGHEVVHGMGNCDIVQFTGGEDVSPYLYGEATHQKTYNSIQRDEYEIGIFQEATKMDLPMVGICRGGQFLNVMCGGKMFQHVDGHALADTHYATDTFTGVIHEVSSTHHQMMRCGKWGKTVGIASEASYKEYMDADGIVATDVGQEADVEVVSYSNHKVLCFQPHPEFFAPGHDCFDWYFTLIERELF